MKIKAKKSRLLFVWFFFYYFWLAKSYLKIIVHCHSPQHAGEIPPHYYFAPPSQYLPPSLLSFGPGPCSIAESIGDDNVIRFWKKNQQNFKYT